MPAPAAPPALPGRICVLVLALCLAPLACPAAGLPGAGFAPHGSGAGFPPQSDGTVSDAPSLTAFPLEGRRIVLDGVLDDAAWDLAPAAGGFRQHEPDRGVPASVPTTFKVCHDDEAVYFGLACWEDDMNDVAGYLTRRDEIQASDLVSIYIDPYHDRTTGYNFRVTPDGVQYDAYLFDNGSRDTGWDAVWQAEVSADSLGWYVEVRVPFSSIRFQPQDDMTWGLMVYRWLHGRGEDTGWAMWDRNASGFVSRWGTLTGLRGVTNPHRLEVTPFVVAEATDPAVPPGGDDSWRNHRNFGADFKYGVTGNLTLNATVQPDFGQVEADPATLNLSPFETYYAEKRPFFTEGARFFQHPDFNLFYSRRIGTGDPNSRIRAAAKLTGKVGGDFSLAVLGAATDVGVPGKVHNPFVAGDRRAWYGLVRLGKEFDRGNHYVNLMGTAVRRDQGSFAGVDDPRQQRDGYSGGLDFELNFHDRSYRLHGSVVGTLVDPFGDTRGESYGTGGRLEARKAGGKLRGLLLAAWESDRLDPNDMGYLQAPDEKYVVGNVSYNYDSDGRDRPFTTAVVELEALESRLYAGGSGRDLGSGEQAWSYAPGHRQERQLSLYLQGQHRSFHQGWVYLSRHGEGTDKYATRSYAGRPGPLLTVPGWTHAGLGLTSDWRRPLSLSVEVYGDRGENLSGWSASASVRWNQNRRFSHSLGLGLGRSRNEAQWLTNLANDGSQAGVTGIGGVDHVFGELDQLTWDLTLRTSLLFSRDQSLQLYLQPFLTRGDYTHPRWLAAPDSHDLRSYRLDAAAHDFRYAALNLNLVYRWAFRPGSTLFLVWTHSKERYERRAFAAQPDRWSSDLAPDLLWGPEPRNTFLAKFSYWFTI